MPVPGLKILDRINAAEANARQLETESRHAVDAAVATVDELIAGQSETLRELAELYLPRLSDDAAQKTWSEMQATCGELLLRKEDAHRQSARRLAQATAIREAAEARWQRACALVNEITARCDALAVTLSEQMANDTEFQSLSRRAAEGQARLEQAESSLEEVEHDAHDKLPAYETSKLFRYLRDCDYGTPSYLHRGFNRRWDLWVSRLIDYPKASSGYRFLTTAPIQMRQLISEQRSAVQSTIAEVESRQAVAASSLGLPHLQSEGVQARSEQDEAALATDKARDAEAQAKRGMAEVDDDIGPMYREAISSFQSLLQRTERSLIAARAAETPEMTDDQVVARLRHIETDLAEKQQLLADRSRIANLATSRTASFSDLIGRFRRAQFDHPRSHFDDEFDVEGQLWAILDGTTDAERVWQHMRRYQRLGPSIAQRAADTMQHPLTQVMLHTMSNVVGSALGSYAARAGQQNRRQRNDQRDWF